MNRYRTILIVAAVFAVALGALPASAQTISIVSGNGQLACFGGCFTVSKTAYDPLVVQVTDSAGNPLANQSVSWSLSSTFNATLSGGGATATTTTDAQGMTLVTLFVTGGFQGGQFHAFDQYTITATSGGSSVAFTETQALPDPLHPQVAPIAFDDLTNGNLTPGSVYTGQVGTTSGTPIKVRARAQSGAPVPNVSVFLVNDQAPSAGPWVACGSTNATGKFVALTDATGVATCTPTFFGTAGNGTFHVVIGGSMPLLYQPGAPLGFAIDPGGVVSEYYVFPFTGARLQLVETAPAINSIQTTSATSVTATAGQSVTLSVRLLGASGGGVGGQQVNWTATGNTTGSFSNSSTTTDSTGATSAVFVLASNAPAGTATITATAASDSTKKATFTITVAPPITITGFTKVSGDNQSAAQNAAFAQPLVVQVTTSAGSASGITVQFSASGSVSLSATTAATDANGRAQVTATAGAVTGPASVTASVASNTGVGSQTFSLTVLPPAPAITASSFVNAADFQANSFSPCSLAAVVGSAAALGSSNLVSPVPGLPVRSPNAQVTVSNISAPILGIAPNANGQQQITFQVPCEATAGAASVGLNLGGGTTNVSLTLQAASPGVFQSTNPDGVLRAVLVRPDGSYASNNNPARRGESVVGYFTGLGPTSPAVGTAGVPAPGSQATVQSTVIVGMNGQGVPVVSARLSEDLPGVYLVTFQIPSDMATGTSVSFSVSVIPPGASAPISSATTKIAVQ